MVFTQQAMSCLEKKVSGNLLVSHTFGSQILVRFVSDVNGTFFDKGEQANAVSKGCSEKLHKIIRKIVVMRYFL